MNINLNKIKSNLANPPSSPRYYGVNNLSDLNDNNSNLTTNNTYNVPIKIVLVGPSNCGKTSIAKRFVANSFNKSQGTTVGSAFFSKQVSVPINISNVNKGNNNNNGTSFNTSNNPSQGNNKDSDHLGDGKANLNEEEKSNSTLVDVRIEIWDTAGQEKYFSMAPMYFRNAAGAILVFDATDALNTFNKLESVWLPELLPYLRNCGNKRNFNNKRGNGEDVKKGGGGEHSNENNGDNSISGNDNRTDFVVVCANKVDCFNNVSASNHTSYRESNISRSSKNLFFQNLDKRNSDDCFKFSTSPGNSVNLGDQNSNCSINNTVSSFAYPSPSYFEDIITGMKDIEDRCKKRGIKLFFTSAKENMGIKDVFMTLVEKIIEERRNVSAASVPPGSSTLASSSSIDGDNNNDDVNRRLSIKNETKEEKKIIKCEPC